MLVIYAIQIFLIELKIQWAEINLADVAISQTIEKYV